MRRTLVVLVTTAAFLVPAVAASAGGSNASCNNGRGGNGAEYNGAGNAYDKKLAEGAVSCGEGVDVPPVDDGNTGGLPGAS